MIKKTRYFILTMIIWFQLILHIVSFSCVMHDLFLLHIENCKHLIFHKNTITSYWLPIVEFAKNDFSSVKSNWLTKKTIDMIASGYLVLLEKFGSRMNPIPSSAKGGTPHDTYDVSLNILAHELYISLFKSKLDDFRTDHLLNNGGVNLEEW